MMPGQAEDKCDLFGGIGAFYTNLLSGFWLTAAILNGWVLSDGSFCSSKSAADNKMYFVEYCCFFFNIVNSDFFWYLRKKSQAEMELILVQVMLCFKF